MVQTNFVHDTLLRAHKHLTFSITGMSTTGDEVLNVALAKIGSKSLFTKELEVALHEKVVDIVVHSLKDMPTQLPDGMALGAIMKREDPRDALVLRKDLHAKPESLRLKLSTLPAGSVVGTSSVRRAAQLRRRFPNLVFKDVRGNLNTRLAKLDDPAGPYSALLLAYAGLSRLGWHDRISEVLNEDVIFHAVGQGALGIEIRADDSNAASVVSVLNDPETALRCIAERAFMRGLEGGCSVPLGVWTELAVIGGGKATLRLKGCVCSLDGEKYIEDGLSVEVDMENENQSRQSAQQLGHDLSVKFIALGAQAILAEIRS
ncbi:hypothetical protein HDU83_000606 [Entophlyctis luteolus]|nr:hypothetical protein HDU83_000606 [Entophlyctis luteolus]